MKTETPRTYLVTGFMDAGKTTYIQDLIFRDYFHKREHGKTLILAFEIGEVEYDTEKLAAFRTEVAEWEGGDIATFLYDAIRKHSPDRIFVEANCMTEGLTDILFRELNITSTTMLIDAETLDLYYANMLQLLQDMVKISDPVIFNRAEEKEQLEPYSTAFRLMNQRGGFLWKSPMGYHEKVFGNALSYDRTRPHICLAESDYPLFYLDALEYPEYYTGKEIEMDVQIDYGTSEAGIGTELLINPVGALPAAKPLTGQNGEMYCAVGRTVMTCCMNDIQFLNFPLKSSMPLPPDRSFIHLTAKAKTFIDPTYKKQSLAFEAICFETIPYPSQLVLSVRGGK